MFVQEGKNMYYLIKEKLEETSRNKFRKGQSQYVAVLTLEEWRNTKEDFEMGIDLDIDPNEIYSTKAVVNYDSLTGCFSIPDRDDFGKYYDFLFALDEKGIVFIDDHNYVRFEILLHLMDKIQMKFLGNDLVLHHNVYHLIQYHVLLNLHHIKDIHLLKYFQRYLLFHCTLIL